MGASRRLAAIVFTDIAGFTALTQDDEPAALALVRDQERLVRPLLAEHRGRRVKSTGDGMLLEFRNTLDAVEFSVELQRRIRARNRERGATDLGLRIGLHLGDVQGRRGDILGDAVNIAARLQHEAEVGGICLSAPVYDQVHNKVGYPFVRLGSRSLRGVREPPTLYRLVLPWSPPPGSPDGASPSRLAVLPLANISPDPGDAYFADGLTEELITAVSQIRGLRVIARSSVLPYKTAPKPVSQVGAELGVAAVLEGSVRKAGPRLRISLKLVDVDSQEPTWAQTFDRELTDVFAVQSEVASRTAESLQLTLARRPPPGPAPRPTSNLPAYERYLKALVAAQEPDGSRLDEAARCFEEATKLDPGFAEAYAAWAEMYVVAAGDYLPMRDVIPNARRLVARALTLDPDLSDGHAAAANIAFQFDHDWDRAEREFREAIRLNPSNVTAHRFFGRMLLALNRFDEAREALQAATRLDPGGTHGQGLAFVDLLAGRFPEAIAHAEEECARRPTDVGPRVFLGITYLTAGRPEEARRAADRPLTGASDTEEFDHALLNALLGRPAEARAVLARVARGEAGSYTSPTHCSLLYAALGEGERALDLLEEEYERGDRVLWSFYRGRWYDGLRDHPRFVALLRRYGLPTGPPPVAPGAPAPRRGRARPAARRRAGRDRR